MADSSIRNMKVKIPTLVSNTLFDKKPYNLIVTNQNQITPTSKLYKGLIINYGYTETSFGMPSHGPNRISSACSKTGAKTISISTNVSPQPNKISQEKFNFRTDFLKRESISKLGPRGRHIRNQSANIKPKRHTEIVIKANHSITNSIHYKAADHNAEEDGIPSGIFSKNQRKKSINVHVHQHIRDYTSAYKTIFPLSENASRIFQPSDMSELEAENFSDKNPNTMNQGMKSDLYEAYQPYCEIKKISEDSSDATEENDIRESESIDYTKESEVKKQQKVDDYNYKFPKVRDITPFDRENSDQVLRYHQTLNIDCRKSVDGMSMLNDKDEVEKFGNPDVLPESPTKISKQKKAMYFNSTSIESGSPANVKIVGKVDYVSQYDKRRTMGYPQSHYHGKWASTTENHEKNIRNKSLKVVGTSGQKNTHSLKSDSLANQNLRQSSKQISNYFVKRDLNQMRRRATETAGIKEKLYESLGYEVPKSLKEIKRISLSGSNTGIDYKSNSTKVRKSLFIRRPTNKKKIVEFSEKPVEKVIKPKKIVEDVPESAYERQIQSFQNLDISSTCFQSRIGNLLATVSGKNEDEWEMDNYIVNMEKIAVEEYKKTKILEKGGDVHSIVQMNHDEKLEAYELLTGDFKQKPRDQSWLKPMADYVKAGEEVQKQIREKIDNYTNDVKYNVDDYFAGIKQKILTQEQLGLMRKMFALKRRKEYFTSSEAYLVDKILGSIPFFLKFDSRTRLMLIANSEFVEFKKGDVIFHQGDVPDNMYVILYGSVNVLVTKMDICSKKMKQVAVAHMSDGYSFGEFSLMNKKTVKTNKSALQDLKKFLCHVMDGNQKPNHKKSKDMKILSFINPEKLRDHHNDQRRISTSKIEGIHQQQIMNDKNPMTEAQNMKIHSRQKSIQVNANKETFEERENEMDYQKYQKKLEIEKHTVPKTFNQRLDEVTQLEDKKKKFENGKFRAGPRRTATIKVVESCALLKIDQVFFQKVIMAIIKPELDDKIKLLSSISFFKVIF